jgi:5-methylcytosine-specific restriction enzyme B
MINPLPTSSSFEFLLAHLQLMGDAVKVKATDDPVYQEFIRLFPADNIANLTLQQYCIGKGDSQSFCWWLERGLEPVLGRYMPGTSRGHIIYYQPDGTVYKHRNLKDLPDQAALSYTLAVQAEIANVTEDKDWHWIDNRNEIFERAGVEPRVTIGDARKLRLLAVYHTESAVPISSPNHIGHFLEKFGYPKLSIPPEHKPVARMFLLREYYLLAKRQLHELTPLGFMRALYSPDLKLAPVKDVTDENDVVDDEVTGSENSMKAIPLNQILYGPPGTGKTYETIRAALSILEPQAVADYDSEVQSAQNYKDKQRARSVLKARFDRLHNDNHIQFVTFHQSFSYEDFVEGIRAEADEATKQIQYQVVDGVFKSLCELADVKVTKQSEAPVDLSGRRVWKMSLGNTLGSDAGIYDECIENDYILLGYGNGIDFTACNNKAEIQALFEANGVSLKENNDYNLTSVTTFTTKMEVGDLVVVSDGNFKFRAIGEITGDYEYQLHQDDDDTYTQRRKIKWLRQFTPSLPHSELLNGQFSQMTLYELKKPSLDKEKLQALLGAKTRKASSTDFSVGQVIGKDYKVIRVTPDLIELKKPNDNLLPFAMNMLEELATAVRQGKITVDDIRKKSAIEKLPGSHLEPYLINGYQNVLAPLVQHILSAGKPDSTTLPTNARVLIIDEINRGNISRILGELISLIEPSKRAGASEELEVTLPYSKKRFKVPNNLYIIGTMNTADRSLAGLDLALRRRFTFVEMPPKPDLLKDVEIDGINLGDMLQVMNERITALLDRDHCIGHAYFMPLLDNPSLDLLADIFAQNILPLLQEYFFEDWQRIRWVLADQTKPDSLAFIVKDSSMDAPALFPGVQQFKMRDCWRINNDALLQAEAYQLIYQASNAITEQDQ